MDDQSSAKFHALLLKAVNPNRSPQGLVAALESTVKEDARNIWLDQGFLAWYAWFRIDKDTKEELARMEENDLRLLASSICVMKTHDSVPKLFSHLFYTQHRAQNLLRKY